MAWTKRTASKIWTLIFVLGLLSLVKEGLYGGILITFLLACVAWRRWGESPRAAMNATRVSWKWTALLVVVFAFTPLAGGHGVAPLGLLLFLGFEHFLVPTVLGWLGVLALAASPWIPSSPARALALVGANLLFATLILAQVRTDYPLLAALLSLPFLAAFTFYGIHLLRIRALPPAALRARS